MRVRWRRAAGLAVTRLGFARLQSEKLIWFNFLQENFGTIFNATTAVHAAKIENIALYRRFDGNFQWRIMVLRRPTLEPGERLQWDLFYS
jgi:hypothetical protein